MPNRGHSRRPRRRSLGYALDSVPLGSCIETWNSKIYWTPTPDQHGCRAITLHDALLIVLLSLPRPKLRVSLGCMVLVVPPTPDTAPPPARINEAATITLLCNTCNDRSYLMDALPMDNRQLISQWHQRIIEDCEVWVGSAH